MAAVALDTNANKARTFQLPLQFAPMVVVVGSAAGHTHNQIHWLSHSSTLERRRSSNHCEPAGRPSTASRLPPLACEAIKVSPVRQVRPKQTTVCRNTTVEWPATRQRTGASARSGASRQPPAASHSAATSSRSRVRVRVAPALSPLCAC